MQQSKTMRSSNVIALTVILPWAAFAAAPQNAESLNYWAQWRGPLQNGVAPQGDPPTEWSETKNVKWKLKIPGDGDATPIIWGDKVFVLTAIPTGKKAEPKAAGASDAFRRVADAPVVAFGQVQQAPPGQQRGGPGGQGRGRGGPGGRGGGPPPSEIYQWSVICVDRNAGKVLWQKVAREEVPHEGHQQNNTYASYSPVTDGEHVYVSFGSWGVYCYDFKGGLKWHRDLGKMRSILGFGEGGSPALHDSKLVINWDHEGDDFITALDAKTGETLWKTARDERMTWTTPLIVKTDKGTQVVVPASGKTRSYDLATGKLLWECAGQTANVIPSAVTGHDLVYAISGFRGNSLQAIRYDRTGDLTDTDAVVWSIKKATPYVPSPLLYDDLLYFFSNNNNILSCYEAKTGKALIDAQRVEGLGDVYASPVGASGRVYLTGRDGRAVVLKKGSQFEVVASNKLDDRFDASPSIVGKQLFLRGHENLYCIAE
jgi:outer membrane protein assembly factor BamB